MRWTLGIGAIAILTLLAGCTHTRGEVSATRVELPDGFAGSQGAGTASAESRWWLAFEDAALNDLVERALEDNLDLRQSWARLAQFEALAEQQGSLMWPQINADISASRFRSIGFDGNAAHNNQFSITGAAAYEVDLWGRIGALDEAATLDAYATREDLEALAMTLSAQVAEVWFGLVEQRAQEDLLTTQIETNEQFLELVELRFSQGLASALDVYQQRQQVLATRSQMPLVRARRDAQAHALAALLGVPAGSLQTTDIRALPSPPPVPDTGVPSELLQRRPDLRSARARVASADRRVAAAIAERFPAIRLTGAAGLQANNLGDLIDNFIWNVASSLVMPLFDGGRRAAEVERQRAALQERLGFYTKVVLQAFKEVQDALVSEKHQRDFLTLNDEQLDVARSTLREARARYVQGLSDYLPVLTALQRVQQIEQNQLSARRQLLSFRIQLHRALGGDWTSDLSAPEPFKTPEEASR